MNSISITGRLVRDPETKTTNTGKVVVSLTLAVRKRLKPRDESEPDADFFNVKVWGQAAEYVNNYGSKGRLAAVVGRHECRKYTDKDGQIRDWWEVTADQVEFLDRPTDDSGQDQRGHGSTQKTRQAAPPAGDEYDPFADE